MDKTAHNTIRISGSRDDISSFRKWLATAHRDDGWSGYSDIFDINAVSSAINIAERRYMDHRTAGTFTASAVEILAQIKTFGGCTVFPECTLLAKRFPHLSVQARSIDPNIGGADDIPVVRCVEWINGKETSIHSLKIIDDDYEPTDDIMERHIPTFGIPFKRSTAPAAGMAALTA
jgi:hypothetical protein